MRCVLLTLSLSLVGVLGVGVWFLRGVFREVDRLGERVVMDKPWR